MISILQVYQKGCSNIHIDIASLPDERITITGAISSTSFSLLDVNDTISCHKQVVKPSEVGIMSAASPYRQGNSSIFINLSYASAFPVATRQAIILDIKYHRRSDCIRSLRLETIFVKFPFLSRLSADHQPMQTITNMYCFQLNPSR